MQKNADMVAEITELVLSNNIFEFNGGYYMQTSGTAMDTHMAPGYVNIFMADFVNKHLKNAPFTLEKIL